MVITWYGENCYKIQTGDKVILTDPFESQTGLTAPRFKSDIVLKTLVPVTTIKEGISSTDEIQNIFNAGEYDIEDISIRGIQLINESTESFIKTAYLIKAEGINICFLGHISEMPEPSVLEKINDVDILFVPAGSIEEAPFLNTKTASLLVKNLEPKIVVPTLFKTDGLKRKAVDVKDFALELQGKKGEEIEPQEKLVVKKKDLTEVKSAQIIVLKI